VESGKLEKHGYAAVAEELVRRFGCKKVAITLRTSLSASRNLWSGMLYSEGKAYFAQEYDLQIVDRVGGGDSFGGGLVYALATGRDDQSAIDFAVAASALKHSIEHDFNLVSVAEVEALAAGNGTGRVQR
jgi:2-dehydro-3-deoxygluconokinase